jgi:hypothetical protein
MRRKFDLLKLITMDSGDSTIYGSGAPVGVPSSSGLSYVDVSNGLRYLSRNVLNFNSSAAITTPTIVGVRRVEAQFLHNDPSPTAIRQLWDGPEGVQTRARRESTTGNMNAVAGFGLLLLDGVAITNNTTNPSAGVWHSYIQNQNSDRQFGFIGQTNAGGLRWPGLVRNIRVYGISNNLLADYAIDEGTGNGSTIYDSSGNNQHGTLTLGSGSWSLEWMLADPSIIVVNSIASLGTPSASGLTVLELSTNKVYRSRNVLTAAISPSATNIALPEFTSVRRIDFKFKHNDANPAANRQMVNQNAGLANRTAVSRLAISSNISCTGNAVTQVILDGSSIPNNTGGAVADVANVWHTLSVRYGADGSLNRIFNNTNIGQIADFSIYGGDDVLLASYPIEEGAGTTIIDSVSGQNGTLTIGTGSWQLDWVPL